jgi:hypothetical protein
VATLICLELEALARLRITSCDALAPQKAAFIASTQCCDGDIVPRARKLIAAN